MSKSSTSFGGFLRVATLLLLAFVLLASPILSACSRSSGGGGKVAEEDTDERLPVIFIPGITGSILRASKDLHALWPPEYPENPVPPSVSLEQLNKDFVRLSLNPATGPHEKIFAPDVIRTYLGDQFYGPVLDYLSKEGGYTEYGVSGNPDRRTMAGAYREQDPKPSLFVFAYDWRLAIEDNAALLADYVNVAGIYHPGKKVNIVTHSMGGLVARRYILDHPGKVDKLITVAAPFLGSAKPLYQMIYGVLAVDYSWAGLVKDALFSDTVKEMLSYYPGLHELLLSKSYYDLGGPPYTVDKVISSDKPERPLTYEELMGPGGLVDRLFPNASYNGKTPAQTNRDFHAYTAGGNNQDDWSRDSTGVKYYHLFGVQKSGDTPQSLREGVTADFAAERNVPAYYLRPEGPGDATVPQLSAERIAPGKNLNAPNAQTFIFNTSQDKLLEHGAIITNPAVMTKVLELLGDTTEPPTLVPTPTSKPTATTVALAGGKWLLAETRLPTLPKQPVLWSDEFGDNSATVIVNESGISSRVVTSKQGKEVGTSTTTLRWDKPPSELTGLQKVQWQATWEITGAGVPRYASGSAELRQGDFQGERAAFSLKENPKGTLSFAWNVPNVKAGAFELSARLAVRGGFVTVTWVYRTK